jgi:hypothetical protein
MGLKSWLARKGAVGGTARWAANVYKFFRNRYPDQCLVPDADLFRFMIVTRYEVFPDEPKKDYLLSQCDHVQGLLGLVVEILKVEASLHENDGDTLYMFIEVIDEELTKAGIPAAARLGTHACIGDYAQQAVDVPRVG